jgi:hypothetical protein
MIREDDLRHWSWQASRGIGFHKKYIDPTVHQVSSAIDHIHLVGLALQPRLPFRQDKTVQDGVHLLFNHQCLPTLVRKVYITIIEPLVEDCPYRQPGTRFSPLMAIRMDRQG